MQFSLFFYMHCSTKNMKNYTGSIGAETWVRNTLSTQFPLHSVSIWIKNCFVLAWGAVLIKIDINLKHCRAAKTYYDIAIILALSLLKRKTNVSFWKPCKARCHRNNHRNVKTQEITIHLYCIGRIQIITLLDRNVTFSDANVRWQNKDHSVVIWVPIFQF